MITTLGSATHVGLKRTNNEDSYGAFPELGLWLVADGMGGADAGEVASRIAVDQVRAACAEGAPVEAAIEEANRAVGEAIAGGQGRPGMASAISSSSPGSVTAAPICGTARSNACRAITARCRSWWTPVC